jgi:hypothetical protein
LRHKDLAQCRVGTLSLRLEKEKTTKKKERKTEDRVGFTEVPSHTIAREAKSKRLL